RRRPWSDAQHALGAHEREARHIARNGREAIEGFRWRRGGLACATGPIRPCPCPPRPAEAKAAQGRVGIGVYWPLDLLPLPQAEAELGVDGLAGVLQMQ